MNIHLNHSDDERISSSQHISAQQANRKYYKQYLEIVHNNFIISNGLIQLETRKEQLLQMFLRLNKKVVKNVKDRTRPKDEVRKPKPRRSTKRSKELYLCQFCGRPYVSEATLKQHMKIKHSDELMRLRNKSKRKSNPTEQQPQPQS